MILLQDRAVGAHPLGSDNPADEETTVPARSNQSLVILLHGVGSNGADIAPLGGAFASYLPHASFVSPDAPEPSAFGSGYQWFSVMGVTEANRAARIEAARVGFDRIVTGLIEQHGFAGKLDRVAFIGFSQGSIMSLDALATGRWAAAGVLAFSGRLVSAEPFAPKPDARALLIHGAADPVIPAWETRDAAVKLKTLGVDVESHILPGIGHTITPASIPMAGAFLAKCLGA